MVNSCFSFSEDSDLLAISSADGKICIFDTGTASLRQEYKPDSHLSSPCSCLTWKHGSCFANPPKKKRKASKCNTNSDIVRDTLLAFGTETGSLMVYSVNIGKLVKDFSDFHSRAVKCICWRENRIFSADVNGNVAEWSLDCDHPLRTFKSTLKSVTAMCITPSSDCAIVARRKIRLLNLGEDEPLSLRSYTGHENSVKQMKILETVLGSDQWYFASLGFGERLVNIWLVSDQVQANKVKNSIASFISVHEVLSFDIGSSVSNGVTVCTAVSNGTVDVFRHTINGGVSKPVVPLFKVTVQSTDSATVLPIIAFSILCPSTVLICYGAHHNPSVEKVELHDVCTDVLIEREEKKLLTPSLQTAVNKAVVPVKSCNMTTLAPGFMEVNRKRKHVLGASVPVSVTSEAGVVETIAGNPCGDDFGGKAVCDSLEPTIEEQLLSLSAKKEPAEIASEQPVLSTSNMALLLGQALQSDDKPVLNRILQKTSPMLITATVRNIKSQYLGPLLNTLISRLKGSPQVDRRTLCWIRSLLHWHLSYFKAVPEMLNDLQRMKQILEGRTYLLSRLSRLQGKLDLALDLIHSRTNTNIDEIDKSAVIVYNEEDSDDDEDTLGDAHDAYMAEILDGSASSEHWDEEESDVAIFSDDNVSNEDLDVK